MLFLKNCQCCKEYSKCKETALWLCCQLERAGWFDRQGQRTGQTKRWREEKKRSNCHAAWSMPSKRMKNIFKFGCKEESCWRRDGIRWWTWYWHVPEDQSTEWIAGNSRRQCWENEEERLQKSTLFLPFSILKRGKEGQSQWSYGLYAGRWRKWNSINTRLMYNL